MQTVYGKVLSGKVMTPPDFGGQEELYVSTCLAYIAELCGEVLP
jgi:hypothetical protein